MIYLLSISMASAVTCKQETDNAMLVRVPRQKTPGRKTSDSVNTTIVREYTLVRSEEVLYIGCFPGE